MKQTKKTAHFCKLIQPPEEVTIIREKPLLPHDKGFKPLLPHDKGFKVKKLKNNFGKEISFLN